MTPLMIPDGSPPSPGQVSSSTAGQPSGAAHFDAPFRLGVDGKPVMVAQNSPEEVGAAVYNILVCPQGAKLADPMFGMPSPLFQPTPLDLTAILRTLQRLEPRADYTLSDVPTLLDWSERNLTVTAQVPGLPTPTASS